MPNLGAQLELERCPHCQVHRPYLAQAGQHKTTSHSGRNHRFWVVYFCNRCGGGILCASLQDGGPLCLQYPASQRSDNPAIPERANSYLNQAIESLHSPAGAVMLSASAVDAMLKAKNYKTGSLFSRIDQAVKDHLITEGMGQWAHEIRLDANDQRHADETEALPTEHDAERIIEFAKALAMFLFVLPAMVDQGRKLNESNIAILPRMKPPAGKT